MGCFGKTILLSNQICHLSPNAWLIFVQADMAPEADISRFFGTHTGAWSAPEGANFHCLRRKAEFGNSNARSPVMGQKMSLRSEGAVSAWTTLHPNTIFVMPYYS
jgi:hypothetical protein